MSAVEIQTSDEQPSLEEQKAALESDLGKLLGGDEKPSGDPLPSEGNTDSDVPEKYKDKTTAELIEMHQNLEAKLGVEPKDADGDPEENPESDPEAPVDDAEKVVEEAGLEFSKFEDEFSKDGKLSEASYEELAKQGINKGMVDQYIQGRQAQVDALHSQVFNEVGGQDNYSSMIDWAKGNWSDSQISAYDNAVNSGDEGQVMLAVNGLKAQFQSAEGYDPSRQVTGSAPQGVSGYASVNELMADMDDPRWGQDPAYMKRVEAKAARSKL